jgi:hypothetical protein
MNVMNTSSLEITENEYCIKLNKETFDLSLVRQLIKRIQAEELFFSRKPVDNDDDMMSRSSSEYEENFDHLDDK